MTDRWHNPNIIRQYVDGELNAEQTASFERAMAEQLELQHAVEFERHLKRAVGRAMADSQPAPAALHDAVIRALDRSEHTTARSEADHAPAAAVVSSGSYRRDDSVAGRIDSGRVHRLFSNPTRANFFAVAASLALVVGAVLFGLLVPQIDQWQSGDGSVNVAQMEVPRFFSQQHCEGAAGGGQIDGRVQFNNPQTAVSMLSGMLGRTVVIFDLSEAGYEFSTAMPCKVCPDDERPTSHIVYKRCIEGLPTVFASVFAVPIEYGIDTNTSVSDWESAATLEHCRTQVVRQRTGGFVYYLTACDPGDFKRLEQAIQSQLDELEFSGPGRDTSPLPGLGR